MSGLRKERENKSKRLFWWLQNPVGKMYYSTGSINFFTVILKSYNVKTLYQMTKISAALHLENVPAESIPDFLASQVSDPCSGNPFLWNSRKQVLYSVGIDRTDNGGEILPHSITTDYVLPLVPKSN
jgi:hypothetical protein